MFKKFHILAFSLLLVFHLDAQVDAVVVEKFGPTELKEDAAILFSDLKACHPGLHAYTPPEVMDSLMVEFTMGLNDSLTQDEFHVRIRKFLRVIGCGHTSARPSEAWYSAMRDSTSVIPVHVLIHENKFYIKDVFRFGADSLIGAQIVAIDGVSSDEIIAELQSIIGGDGLGDVLPQRNLERMFQTYYLFRYGMKAEYTLKLKQEKGEMYTVTLKGTTAGRHEIHKEHDLVDVFEASRAKLGFVDSTHKIAVMDLNSFHTRKYKKFYRKCFKTLSDDESEVLIIDLRGNGGGYFPNGNQLLRYLMNDKFSMDFSRPKDLGKRSKHVKVDLSERLTRFVFLTIPDRNKQDADRNYQIRYKPIKRNKFEGDVYLITDGWTFSTASFVTSKLKNAGRATVVGQETGGGEVGFNAVLEWKLTLPNSSVRVSIPMYHVDVQPNMEDQGRGVLPSISVKYDNVVQRLHNVDLEMQKILDNLQLK